MTEKCEAARIDAPWQAGGAEDEQNASAAPYYPESGVYSQTLTMMETLPHPSRCTERDPC